jgi:hypothetical protein
LGEARAVEKLNRSAFVPPWPDRLWDTFLLFKMGAPYSPPYPWPLEVARWLAPATVIYAALRAVGAIFAQQLAEYRARLGARGHVVIAGLGDFGARLASRFRAAGHRVVAIDKAAGGPAVPAAIEQARAEGVTVVAGDATDPGALGKAAVARAEYLVAVCGDDETNANVAIAARRLVAAPGRGRSKAGRQLRCFVQVGDDRLGRLLEEAVLAGPGTSSQGPARVHLEFFNVVHLGVKALLDEHWGALLEGGCPPHLLAVGTGRFSRHLVAEAARRWWLLQAQGAGPVRGWRCHITLVAPDAPASAKSLQERFPALASASALEPLEADPSDPESPPLALSLQAPARATLAVVCSDGDDAAIVRAAIVVRRSLPHEVAVVMATQSASAVPELLPAGMSNVTTFALLDRVCSPEVLLEKGVFEELAKSVHSDYLRRKPAAAGGDRAQRPWAELPETYRQSNRDQAADIGRKLEMVGYRLEPSASWEVSPQGFTPEQVELLAKAEHDRWCEERLRDGWQFGSKDGKKDEERKLHPDLVHWEELSEMSRDLDRGAVRAIPSLLARLGYAMVPSASGAGPLPP